MTGIVTVSLARRCVLEAVGGGRRQVSVSGDLSVMPTNTPRPSSYTHLTQLKNYSMSFLVAHVSLKKDTELRQ